MKNLSTEIIVIGDKEYTLFLNRKGLVAFEKYSQEEMAKIEEIQTKYKSSIEELEKKDCVIKEDTNPFEGLGEFDDIEDDMEVEKNIYIKLYWIMLYENHKLSLNAVKDLYEKACEECGEEEVRKVADEMVEKINIAPKNTLDGNSKNLKALKPTK